MTALTDQRSCDRPDGQPPQDWRQTDALPPRSRRPTTSERQADSPLAGSTPGAVADQMTGSAQTRVTRTRPEVSGVEARNAFKKSRSEAG
jgi:hypothetical protein